MVRNKRINAGEEILTFKLLVRLFHSCTWYGARYIMTVHQEIGQVNIIIHDHLTSYLTLPTVAMRPRIFAI